ncbi:MAG: GNAT family N-acetyltransferase [Chitinophagaceae bacterium]|nr:GNAT family N-acetyltransferase [Chitinophagaceae bacterium]
MITFTIKHYTELSTGELYELLKLRAAVFVVEQNCPYQDCDDKDKTCWHLLGYEHQELIAYARLLPYGLSYDKYCSIGRVAVSLTSRDKNYGRLLMAAAIGHCEKEFGTDIKISAQAYLEKFYRELGFVTVSETYLEDDIPHIAMVRNKH